MQKITTVSELKNAIQQLEDKQANEWTLLKEQLHVTSEELKPVNIIKGAIKDVVMAPGFKKNILDTAIGFTSGILAKKAVVGNSHNPLTKILGMIVEIVVANKISKNTDGIKSIGSILLKKVMSQFGNTEKA